MEKRIILKGKREDCKEFTIFLSWYHSAIGRITSVVRNDEDKTVNLNLLIDEERLDDLLIWAKQYELRVL